MQTSTKSPADQHRSTTRGLGIAAAALVNETVKYDYSVMFLSRRADKWRCESLRDHFSSYRNDAKSSRLLF